MSERSPTRPAAETPAADATDASDATNDADAEPAPPKKVKQELPDASADDSANAKTPPVDDTPAPSGNVVTTPPVEAPKPTEEAPPIADKPKPIENDPRYSHGTGGGSGLVEQAFTASNGLVSSYKIMVPADASATKAYGLHVHVHGDGGGGYTDFPNKETRKDLIGVTVKAPNNSLTWGRAAGATHGVFLQELIQNELLKKYNVDLKRIYFSGVSGGSYFLSGNFIPTYGKFYKTGAFLMCGGEAPRVAFDEPAFLKEFNIHWQVTAGERNDISTSVARSIAAYKTALTAAGGAATQQASEVLGPGGHCEFDDVAYTSGIQYMMDLKFDVVLHNDL